MSIDWRLIVLAVALWFILRYGAGPQQAEARRVSNVVKLPVRESLEKAS